MALESGPAPQVGRFLFKFTLGVHFLFLNSCFVGEVALDLGPAADVAFFNSRVNQKVHEKGRCESCGALDLTILHRISVRTTLRRRFFLWIVVNFWIFHEKGRHESCGALDRCILHRISVRTTL